MKSAGTSLLAAALAACGGSEASPPPMNPWLATVTVGGSTQSVTVTYTSAGVSPTSIMVASGGTINFVNNDSVSHWPSSGLFCAMVGQQFMQCPWLNTSATVAAGNSAQSSGTAAATPATCSLLDRDHPPPCGGGGGGY
ncbi:MAG TPA: hypothetical protein VFR85_19815 [Anaeromyxobacteraceae bacterium]|nr:hypothetical protein [Anaeromyxobacteraceae bacterium]